MREPVIVAWSGGKDSALALHELQGPGTAEVVGLLTTVNEDHQRVTMHGVRRSLLERQAAALGYPLRIVEIPDRCSDDEYQARMRAALLEYRARGVRTVVHGDIFLEDVRRYREEMLAGIDMRADFPLWGADTAELAGRFCDLGFRAVVTCVDTEKLEAPIAGRLFEPALIRSMPSDVDPCGENGEFHTFVFDGPPFLHPVDHVIGEIVVRDERFAFRDLEG